MSQIPFSFNDLLIGWGSLLEKLPWLCGIVYGNDTITFEPWSYSSSNMFTVCLIWHFIKLLEMKVVDTVYNSETWYEVLFVLDEMGIKAHASVSSLL